MALLGHQLDELSLMNQRTTSTPAWLYEHHLFSTREKQLPTIEEAMKRPVSTALHTRALFPSSHFPAVLALGKCRGQDCVPGGREMALADAGAPHFVR